MNLEDVIKESMIEMSHISGNNQTLNNALDNEENQDQDDKSLSLDCMSNK